MYVCILVSHLLYEQQTYEKENNHAFQFVSVAIVAQKLHDCPALAPMSQSQSSSDDIPSSADYTVYGDSSVGEPPGIALSSDAESTRARSIHGDTCSYDSSSGDTEPWERGEPSEVSAEVQEQLDLAKEDRRRRRREARDSELIKRKPKHIQDLGYVLCVRPIETPGARGLRWAYPCHFARTDSYTPNEATEKKEWDERDSELYPIRFRKAIRREGYYPCDRYTLRKFIYRSCNECGHWNRRREDQTCPIVYGTDCVYDESGPLRCIMRTINADYVELLTLSVIRADTTIAAVGSAREETKAAPYASDP